MSLLLFYRYHYYFVSFYYYIILLFTILYYDFMISIYIIILCFKCLFSFSCSLSLYYKRHRIFFRWTQKVVFVQRSSRPNPSPPCLFLPHLHPQLPTHSYHRLHFFSSLNLSLSHLFFLPWLPATFNLLSSAVYLTPTHTCFLISAEQIA